MAVKERHPKEFLVGAAVGTLLGGISTLLLAPQSGSQLREDLSHTYQDLARKAHDFSDDLGYKKKSFARSAGSTCCHWTDKVKGALENISGGLKTWGEEEGMDSNTKDFIVGGIVGGILGAVAGLLLAPKPGNDLRHDLADTYHDISDRTHEFAHDVTKRGKRFAKTTANRTNKWLNFAKDFIEEITDEAQEVGHEVSDRAKDFTHHRLDDAMELASLGYKLWKKFNK